MTWMFERGGERLRCEIRRDADGQDYEFVVATAEGPERVERFADPAALISRSVEYFRLLMVDGWEAPSDSRVL
jgi:hypothetical protein